MVGAIRDHAAELAVEAVDDRLGVGAAAADGQVERPRDQRRRAELQPGLGLLGMVLDQVVDDQFVHQRVVDLAGEQLPEAVLLALRSHEGRPGALDAAPIRIALDDGDPAALESGEGRRRHVGAAAADQHQPVLEVGLGEEQHPLALRILPRAALPSYSGPTSAAV